MRNGSPWRGRRRAGALAAGALGAGALSAGPLGGGARYPLRADDFPVVAVARGILEHVPRSFVEVIEGPSIAVGREPSGRHVRRPGIASDLRNAHIVDHARDVGNNFARKAGVAR